jgi:hypothetical protein
MIIINKPGHGSIMPPRKHPIRRSLRVKLLLILLLCRAIRPIAANHLLRLVTYPHALHHLHVLHPAQNLVLHREPHLDAERGALLDREGLVFEVFEDLGLCLRGRGGEVNDYVGAAFDFEAEGEDGAFAWVGGVEGLAGAQAEGFFPFAEGFVVFVW